MRGALPGQQGCHSGVVELHAFERAAFETGPGWQHIHGHLVTPRAFEALVADSPQGRDACRLKMSREDIFHASLSHDAHETPEVSFIKVHHERNHPEIPPLVPG